MRINRIAVSGTYSTGKTTTSFALSYLLGIPRTHAQTMRELLPIIHPGKRLEECTPSELYELGIRRLTERINCEAMLPNGFISDGSALHEWVYGKARLKIGLNPNANKFKRIYDKVRLFTQIIPMSEFIENYEYLVKSYAQKHYDIFIHLPNEFPIVKDGHRPINEKFRILSEKYLIDTIQELGIKHITVGGSIEDRLKQIVEYLKMPMQMSFEDAILLAKKETLKRNSIEIEYNNSLKK